MLSIRHYFSAGARLKLLAIAEEATIEVHSLDLTSIEKEKLYTAARPFEMACAKVAIPRDEHIVHSISSLEDDVPSVCILGIQHAHNILNKLKGSGIKVIPCYVEDSWAPEIFKSVLCDSYPPALRVVDGLLEFTSVAVAMQKLRDEILPYTLAAARRTEATTSLTSLLFRATHLPFYSVRSENCIVSAITKLSTLEEKSKALSIVRTLGAARFFMCEGESHFGLAGINLSVPSGLSKKIYDAYCSP